MVTLGIKGKHVKQSVKRIHRLVATAFIPNPNNYPVVNHKDKIRNNNCVENLEWCTVAYNTRYSICKPVIQMSLDGKFIAEFESVTEAAREYGISATLIRNCCTGERQIKTCHKCLWRYKNEYDANKDYSIEPPQIGRYKRLAQYDLEGNLIKIYDKLRDVNCKEMSSSVISSVCSSKDHVHKTAYGYKWAYID